jgi:hypothetical protein
VRAQGFVFLPQMETDALFVVDIHAKAWPVQTLTLSAYAPAPVFGARPAFEPTGVAAQGERLFILSDSRRSIIAIDFEVELELGDGNADADPSQRRRTVKLRPGGRPMMGCKSLRGPLLALPPDRLLAFWFGSRSHLIALQPSVWLSTESAAPLHICDAPSCGLATAVIAVHAAKGLVFMADGPDGSHETIFVFDMNSGKRVERLAPWRQVTGLIVVDDCLIVASALHVDGRVAVVPLAVALPQRFAW